MVDALFGTRRLARLYDVLEEGRGDLEAYTAMVREFGAKRVLDIGCGTGELACMLARNGVEVVGLDPAGASLEVAREKPGAERVRWIEGDATTLPPLQVDLAVMTGNVAQVFLTDEAWASTVQKVAEALVPGGRFVFETRDPAREAWTGWNREQTYRRLQVPGDEVETWGDLVSVELPYVSFQATYVFASDGARLVSGSTLRFRNQEELESSVVAAGLRVDEVRDAPDRPGLEWVYVTSKQPGRILAG